MKRSTSPCSRRSSRCRTTKFEGGTDRVFDVKTDGVGYGKLSADVAEYEPDVKSVQEKIASGELDVPSAG